MAGQVSTEFFSTLGVELALGGNLRLRKIVAVARHPL